MRFLVTAALLAPLLVLAACASTSGYGPAEGTGYGYKDTRIEANRYRVSYKGRDQADAEAGALRRAAELAVARGDAWFTVVSRETDAEARRRSGPTVGIGGSTGGGRGGFGGGVGVGVSLPLGGGGSGGARTVFLEVLTGSGPRPDGPQTYDASAVLANATGA